jgi:hypothetical protein
MRNLMAIVVALLLLCVGCKSKRERLGLAAKQRVIYCGKSFGRCNEAIIVSVDDDVTEVRVAIPDNNAPQSVDPNLLIPIVPTQDKKAINNDDSVFVKCRVRYNGAPWTQWIWTTAEKLSDGKLKLYVNAKIEYPDSRHQVLDKDVPNLLKECGIDLSDYDFDTQFTVVLTTEQSKRLETAYKAKFP